LVPEDTRSRLLREWLKNRHVGQAFQPVISFPEVRNLTKEDFGAIAVHARHLPHWELTGATYFVTFRTDKAVGPILADQGQAGVVEEALWFGYSERYLMHAYVIMPDHVHMLFEPITGVSLSKILQSIKGFTARRINMLAGRKGPLWQNENFDHLIRNDRDWLDKFKYIHDNPITAGLAARPQDYPFSSLVTMHSKGRMESLTLLLSE
jgi:putative transposase